MRYNNMVTCYEICSECHDILLEKVPDFLYDYLTLCELYIKGSPLIFRGGCLGHGKAAHRQLEKNGFLTSLEINEDDIVIKPTGYKYEKGKHEFCAFRQKH